MGRPAGETLQPTALVHEAWIRMARAEAGSYENRSHFVSVAAKAMRQILVDQARQRGALKRGGDGGERVTISGVESDAGPVLDVLDLQDALTNLEATHPRHAKVAELRFFGGLEMTDIAQILGTSKRTTDSDWRFAKAWLRRAIAGDDAGDDD